MLTFCLGAALIVCRSRATEIKGKVEELARILIGRRFWNVFCVLEKRASGSKGERREKRPEGVFGVLRSSGAR